MKEEHKTLIEKIITELKNVEGFMHINRFVLFFDQDHKLRIAITKIMGDLKLIESISSNYRLTKDGWEFTSFGDLEQKEAQQKELGKLELELAKSNIEANQLNREVAARNQKNEKSNNIATWINVGIGVLNIGLLAWQLLHSK